MCADRNSPRQVSTQVFLNWDPGRYNLYTFGEKPVFRQHVRVKSFDFLGVVSHVFEKYRRYLLKWIVPAISGKFIDKEGPIVTLIQEAQGLTNGLFKHIAFGIQIVVRGNTIAPIQRLG